MSEVNCLARLTAPDWAGTVTDSSDDSQAGGRLQPLLGETRYFRLAQRTTIKPDVVDQALEGGEHLPDSRLVGINSSRDIVPAGNELPIQIETQGVLVSDGSYVLPVVVVDAEGGHERVDL